MKNSPMVTIVTPSFNQGQFIEQTILSVLAQTYGNIQYIVVDGVSTDATMDIVNKYRNRIDTIIHEQDRGQTDAINKGFKLANGELVGWLNSDDILYPNCIEKIVDLYRERPDGSVYYNCTLNIIDVNSTVINNYRRIIPNRNHLLNNNYDIIQQGSLYKRELVEKVNYLNEKEHFCMDLDLWLKLSELAPIYYLDVAPMSAFRLWEANKTSTDLLIFLKDIRRTLLKHGAQHYSLSVLRTYKNYLRELIKINVRRKNLFLPSTNRRE